MKGFLLSLVSSSICMLTVLPACAEDDVAFFETRIRPVLIKHCYECHSSSSAEVRGGLLVDFREGLRAGGESGPAIVPGQSDESLLLEAIRYESLEMPPREKLPDEVIADFAQWISQGAVDPRDEPPSPTQAAELVWKEQLAERSRWWSLQSPQVVAPPSVEEAAWSEEPVDRFVRLRQSQAMLSPATPADAETLLRRLSFVLTGLPPRPVDVTTFPSQFAADPDQATAALVDRLLESPHFGERFARHWMDVVRYTDTWGYEWDNPAKGSWEYRDYLIRAFNDDVGFDQLIREQIAGDLLPRPRINPSSGLNESLIGPMFYHLGEHRHGSSLAFNGIHQEMINNKIDAFSKAFLAMTVACARCHDHKLDAISQADYYALAGEFMSPRWTPRVIDAPGKYATEIAELKRLRSEIHRELASLWQSDAQRLAPSELRTWAESQASAWKEPAVGDLHLPLSRLLKATDEGVSQQWSEMRAEWQSVRDQQQANSSNYDVLTDFSEPGLPAGWISEGDGIAHGYVANGTPLVSLDGDTLITKLLQRGYHTHALSSKLPGAVRMPPQHEVSGRFVSLKLDGGEWAGHLVVPQNAFQNEPLTFLGGEPATSHWVLIADETLTNGVSRVLTEVATSSLHPNFPPRTGLASVPGTKLSEQDDGYDKRSWFSLTGIVTHDVAVPPASPLDEFATLLNGDPPVTVKEGWGRVADWLNASIDRWGTDVATGADVAILNWLLTQKLLPNQASGAPALASLVRQYREVESRVLFPRTVISMDERGLDSLDYPLNVRGNVDEEGPAIPRGFLEVFAGAHHESQESGSGRIELATYLSRRENPLTARVYVNRVWQWIFGTGIVATPSDFGKLGNRPSHPELLDWLAVQFMEEGWSTKQLVRRLVLSQTFRQSGTITPTALERDPENRLLHHYPTRRLEAEAIRDSLLSVAGRLDEQLYGRPINPPRPAADPPKRLFSGPLDGHGRRSIYLEMSIMDPPRFLTCFNLPDLKLPTGRRDVTNVPAQALALLNDPLVVEMARSWAEQVVADGCRGPQERVRAMFIQALGRQPTETEIDRWTDAAIGFSQIDNVMTDAGAWTDVAHAMFNTKEFLYFR